MIKCVYCGEEEATKKIMNPNLDEEEGDWDVCETCREVIRIQEKQAFGIMLAGYNYKFSKTYGNKIITETNTKLEAIRLQDEEGLYQATSIDSDMLKGNTDTP